MGGVDPCAGGRTVKGVKGLPAIARLTLAVTLAATLAFPVFSVLSVTL